MKSINDLVWEIPDVEDDLNHNEIDIKPLADPMPALCLGMCCSFGQLIACNH